MNLNGWQNEVNGMNVCSMIFLSHTKHYAALNQIKTLAKFVQKQIQFVDWGQTALANSEN